MSAVERRAQVSVVCLLAAIETGIVKVISGHDFSQHGFQFLAAPLRRRLWHHNFATDGAVHQTGAMNRAVRNVSIPRLRNVGHRTNPGQAVRLRLTWPVRQTVAPMGTCRKIVRETPAWLQTQWCLMSSVSAILKGPSSDATRDVSSWVAQGLLAGWIRLPHPGAGGVRAAVCVGLAAPAALGAALHR